MNHPQGFALSLVGVTCCAALLAHGQTTLPGITNRWSAEGDATDSVGDADGTLASTVTFTTEGAFGLAFDFAESGGEIDFGTVAGNFGTSDFTISLWIRTTVIERSAVIGKRGACNGAVPFFEIRAYSANSAGGCGPSYGIMGEACTPCSCVQTSGAFNDGEWHHYALRRSGMTLTAFLDGGFQAATSATPVDVTNSTALKAGLSVCEVVDGTNPFPGQLDEIQFYDRALADAEVEILAQGLEPKCNADFNADNQVNASDLAVLLGFWSTPNPLFGDLNNDGTVNASDLALLLGTWGFCE